MTAILSPNGRKARYGVAYLRTVCAQAGVGLTETAPDEDVLASDCDVKFREASVRVQVKCTSQFKIAGSTASWPVEEHWLRSWSAAILPVYFLLVIVPNDIIHWLDHDQNGTFHRTAAFWRRLEIEEVGNRISVPKSQRLTEATFEQWHDDLMAGYKPGAGS